MSVIVLGPNKPFWGARVVQIPLLQELRDRHPGQRLIVFSPVGAPELLDWGLADEVHSYRKGSDPRAWIDLLTGVRRDRPARLFNLRRKSTACCLAAASAPGTRIGYDEGPLAHLLDERIPYDSHIYMSSRYLSLANEGARGARDSSSIRVFRSWMQGRLAGCPAAPPRVLLFPGAGNPAKKWPLARFLAAAKPLVELAGCPATLVLGPAEQRERARLAGSIVEGDGGRCLPEGAVGNEIPVELLDAPPLWELLSLLESTPLVVANDCGPSHLAQLSGRRFLGLYRAGWSTVEDWFLDKENSELLVAPETGGMERISIEAVVEAAAGLCHTPDYVDSLNRFSRAEFSIPRARRS